MRRIVMIFILMRLPWNKKNIVVEYIKKKCIFAADFRCYLIGEMGEWLKPTVC